MCLLAKESMDRECESTDNRYANNEFEEQFLAIPLLKNPVPFDQKLGVTRRASTHVLIPKWMGMGKPALRHLSKRD